MSANAQGARRLRRRRSAESVSQERQRLEETALEKAEVLVAMERKLQKMRQQFESAAAETMAAMENAGQTEVQTSGGSTVKVEIPHGRSVTIVSPQKFKALVTEEDFFSCIKVQVTEAKKVLGEKQLAKISKVTPGVDGDPRLKIEHPKPPTKKL